MSYLDLLGFDPSDFAAIAEASSLFPQSKTVRLELNKRVAFTGSMTHKNANGDPITKTLPCYATLRSAKLTRLSLAQHTSISKEINSQYFLASGVFKDVQMDIELALPNGEIVGFYDFMANLVSNAAGLKMSTDEFLTKCADMKIDYASGLPLFWQHFGANRDKFADLAKKFKDAGATPDANPKLRALMSKENSHIKGVLQLAEGIPVTAMEIGSVDRSENPRNQGFINFLDAQFSQIMRVIGFAKKADVIKSQLTAASGWSQKRVSEAEQKITLYSQMSKQYASNWAGAQERLIKVAEKKYETDQTNPRFDPTHAPCGRFTLLTNGEEYKVDLWKDSRIDAPEAAPKANPNSLVFNDDEMEEPV